MRRRAGGFARDEAGSVTVEMVLWLPFIFGLLMLFIDVSLAFFGRAQAYRVIQDFNRMVSVGGIGEEAPTLAARELVIEERLLAAFETLSPNATAEVTLVNGFIYTKMGLPAKDLILFTSPFLLHNFTDAIMVVGAQHYIEWPNS